jgi:hypothetical protein
MTVAKLRALEGAEFPMSTAQRVSCGFAMLIILSALTGCSDADADIDEDFSIITGAVWRTNQLSRWHQKNALGAQTA